GGERLRQLELLAGVRAGEKLDRAKRLARRPRHRGRRRRRDSLGGVGDSRRPGGPRQRPGALAAPGRSQRPPPPPAGPGRASPPPGRPAAAGRSPIVFSKSALSPPAEAPLASPMNLSLYLPSSMTSLFCRKCFLIGLPLTTVPLVLPRSSRKESFRIVTMTACSPLTARLSIWMSLWGLRPMVVRSLVKGISLSTR